MVAPVLVAASLAAAPAGSQAIYRCDDGRGGVLYTDTACGQGAALDLAPGKASAEAIARLEREQQAFQQRQRARDARAEREDQAARAEREAERRRRQQALDEQHLAEQNVINQGRWGWYPIWPITPPPRPPRPDPVPPAGTLPAQPRVPGR